MAREKTRNGREKFAWEKEFYGKVITKMDVYNLKFDDIGRILGIGRDNLSIKMNDPGKFRLREFFKLIDFLHLDRSEMVEELFKGEKKGKSEEWRRSR